MLALDRLVTPLLNLASDLLVQLADGGCAAPGTPEGLGDVLDAARRDAGVVHLQHRLLGTRLPAAVSLDDRGLERQAAQLGHLQRHLACLGIQLALVMASPGIDPIGAMFVALRTTELVGLSIKHGVEGLLHSGSDDLAHVLLHELLVDLDDLPKELVVTEAGLPATVEFTVSEDMVASGSSSRLTRSKPTLKKCAKHTGRYRFRQKTPSEL